MNLINNNVLLGSLSIFILVIYLIIPQPDIIFKLSNNDPNDSQLQNFNPITIPKCKI